MVQVVNEETGYEVKTPKLNGVVEKTEEKEAKKQNSVFRKPKPKVPRPEVPNPEQPKYKRDLRARLGKYLMTLAKVAEEMDYESDERLLRDYVQAEPPLHIRRTLDQYYFATLDDTSQRDEDQVVYRGTKAGRSHHIRNTRVVMVDQLWLWVLDDSESSSIYPFLY